MLIFNAREHIGHKDVAFGRSMTVSTPPNSRILPGPHDASQCRAAHRSSKKYIVKKLLKTKFSYCSFVSTVDGVS